MTCEVCAAPAIPVFGACVFCRSPLQVEADWTGLLDYLASRLPAARARHGVVHRRVVRSLRIQAADNLYSGKLRGDGGLDLQPQKDPAQWVESLLSDLSRDAARDPAIRFAVTRAGWDLRPS